MNVPAAFLDRDGVLIAEQDGQLITAPEQLTILPGTKEALSILKTKGYTCLVVTNQAVVARGIISETQLETIHHELNRQLGHRIDGFYYCVHHPHAQVKKYRQSCTCRKPKPGLFYQASCCHRVNLAQSILIGDRLTDIAAGQNAGCRTTILVGNTQGQIFTEEALHNITPTFHCADLLTAALQAPIALPRSQTPA